VVEVVEQPLMEQLDLVEDTEVQEHQMILQVQVLHMLEVVELDLMVLHLLQVMVELAVVELAEIKLVDLLVQLTLKVEVAVVELVQGVVELEEQAVQESWSLEHLQVQELFYQQVQDVRDLYLKHQMVDKLQPLQLQEI